MDPAPGAVSIRVSAIWHIGEVTDVRQRVSSSIVALRKIDCVYLLAEFRSVLGKQIAF